MNYAVIQFINGAFSVKYEGSNLNSLQVNYHQWIASLRNDDGAVDGIVKLVDENLDVVEGYMEVIHKPAKNA